MQIAGEPISRICSEHDVYTDHTEHRLSAAVYDEVQARFAAHLTPAGAHFEAPMRVDLLRKPRH
jgi:hypothetical protein